jgi:transposase
MARQEPYPSDLTDKECKILEKLRKVFADGGYAGQLLDWVKALIPQRGPKIEIVKRIAPGFKILPKRWLVERTFAWLGRYRRLNGKPRIPRQPFTSLPAKSCLPSLAAASAICPR